MFAQTIANRPNVSNRALLDRIAALERRTRQVRARAEQARVQFQRDQIAQATRAAMEAAERLEQQRIRAVAQMRQAFRRGADNLAGQILEWTEKAVGLIGTLDDLNEALEGGWGMPRSPGREILKEIASKTLTLASLVANWASAPGLASDAERRIADLQNVLGVAGVIPGPHTIILSYIGPVLGGISSAMTRLIDIIRQENDTAIQVDPDLVRWGSEPGGRPTGNFMAAVMHAESVDEVPAPGEDVIQFFKDERGNFDDVIEKSRAGRTIPTRGLLWWLIDPEQFRIWVFNHRTIVWQLLYGNRPVPPLPPSTHNSLL